MPGKQMSIDAELNAGMITEDVAKMRREKLQKEADFYGAMDGASKFVRGDAVAGILITLVNVIGGIVIGMIQKNMALMDSVERFTLLSIGDGLVSQVPSLIVSVAAGILVTRNSGGRAWGNTLESKLSFIRRRLRVSAAYSFSSRSFPVCRCFRF